MPRWPQGTSSGFGKRLVLSALKRGDFVISSSRSSKLPADFPQSPRIHHIVLDLDSGTDEIKKNVDEAVKIWGRIDVLVNNAGSVLPAMLEEGGTMILQKQLQTNLFGVLDVTNAVLPHMRARKSGTVVFSGSRSSWRTDVPASVDLSSVALGECFAVELEPFKINVLIVEPGGFRTEGMLTTPFYKENPIPDYDELRTRWEYIFSRIPGTQRGDPAKATEIMVDFVRSEGVAQGMLWPLEKGIALPVFLPLGQDCEDAIKEKCDLVLDACVEWKDVLRSTDFDEEK
ncbi:hypothetical protein HWV62_15245 [Athelia sp. TMB]|nr:hypothetical protein HWV62_15245 [Athelia sp. TMB]